MKYEVTSFNTKKMLAESLKKIMKKKSFSKITVSEIIADCGVNRKTFYYHFEDIYALLKWLFETEAIDMVKQFDLHVDYEEAIGFVMDYVEENEYIINCAFDSIGRMQMKHLFYRDFIEMIFSLISNAEKDMGKTLDKEYKNFLCSFYAEALAGMLIDWFQHREIRNRTQVTKYLIDTMKASAYGIIGRAEK